MDNYIIGYPICLNPEEFIHSGKKIESFNISDKRGNMKSEEEFWKKIVIKSMNMKNFPKKKFKEAIGKLI